ncbi:hypothetical protein [Cupriavidus numazuensis]|uniref:HNH endonuclease n=1 Tax=Cupriavidus numazuensis TaxID=221992 RepID=A0ABM8TIE5_9BURK|nr:hypothetical protein [Cupriavidus numazuensis]CAG2147610.1 hypothetical protein LMG26411_03167 [Cupriavidus numazuensis]
MLFGYPIAATQNNWLHECICEAIRRIHAAADARKRYPVWPQILPEEYRENLASRRGLRDRLQTYNRAIRRLSADERALVLETLDAENRIPDLLSGAHDCGTVDSLPEIVQKPVIDLYSFAFDLLTELSLRDEHYAAIYAAAPEHTCPFCGTEIFDAPGAPREDLDHYLARSRYPFAAINLRNLVPMGHKCNSKYKLARDLLRRDDGSRRVAFDPYNHVKVDVILDDSDPFDGSTANTPRWIVRFDPETAEVPTWDEVFSVRERYSRDHLDPSFSRWLSLFGKWARSEIGDDTDEALVAVLRKYEEFWADHGMQDRAFLKAAVFRMLRLHCEAGHRRLIQQLRHVISPSRYFGAL